jgi:HNH endonuclease
VWEVAHGPIPEAMCIQCINGDGHDTRLENLRMVSREENIRINLLKRYPLALRNVMALRGRLNNRINQRQEKEHG